MGATADLLAGEETDRKAGPEGRLLNELGAAVGRGLRNNDEGGGGGEGAVGEGEGRRWVFEEPEWEARS